MTHGWQNESTDGANLGVVFSGMVAMVAVVTSPQLLDVVWCNCSCSCSCSVVSVVVVVSCSCNVL